MKQPNPLAPLSPLPKIDDLCVRLLGLIGGTYIGGVGALFLGFEINFITALAGIVGGLFFTHRFLADRSWRSLFLTVAILALALVISSLFFDSSSDGIGYHKPGILQFLSGWNPYHKNTLSEGLSYWTIVYPKASWICGAQLTALTGQLECGKALNILAMVAAGSAAWSFLIVRIPARPKIAAASALLIALNPIVVAQCMTFYIDGLIASLLTVLLFRVADTISIKITRTPWFEIAACSVLLANLKFTGLVYTGLTLLVAAVFLWRIQGFKPSLRFGLICAAILLPAVLLFGKTPYLDNLTAGRHLFSPLMGAEKIDLLKNFRPQKIAETDRVTRFIIGNFSKSAEADGNPAFNWPFQFKPFNVYSPDNQIGALGPLYGESMVLALLALSFMAIRGQLPVRAASLFVLTAIIVTSFCHEDAWWARYAPQMFLLPPLAAILVIQSKGLIRFGLLLLLILGLNITVVGFNAVGQGAWISYRMNQDFKAMKLASDSTGHIEVNFGDFRPLSRKLQEQGIRFMDIPEASTRGWQLVYATQTCYWRPAAATKTQP